MVFQFLITKGTRSDCSITVYLEKKIAFETIYSVLRIQVIILKAYCVKVILFL